MTVATTRSASPARRKSTETIEFRLLFLVSFVFILIGTALGRLLPRSPAAGRQGRSLISEARASAYACVPYAFM